MTEQVKMTQEINLKKNVIVVMLDTLSADYMGCYGNEWIKTPNMDRLAREGVLFENNYIEGVPTIPCRRTMFTGRYTSIQKAGRHWTWTTQPSPTSVGGGRLTRFSFRLPHVPHAQVRL